MKYVHEQGDENRRKFKGKFNIFVSKEVNKKENNKEQMVLQKYILL